MLSIAKFCQELICACITYPLVLRFREEKRKWFIAAVISWILFSFINCLILVYRIDILPGVDLGKMIQLLGIIVFVFFGGSAVYGGAMRLLLVVLLEDLFLGGLNFFIAAGVAIFSGNTIQYVTGHENIIYHPGITLLNLLLYLLLLYLMKPVFRRFRDSSIERLWVVQGVCLVVFLLSISPFFFKSATYGYQKRDAMPSVIIYAAMICAFAFIGSYYYFEIIRQDNQLLRLELQYLREKMEGLKEQVVWTRKLRHDIKRHINVLGWAEGEKLTKQQEERRNAYRKQLEEFYEQLSLGDYCSDPDVNAAISQLERNCRRQGIPLDVQLKNADFSSLEQPLEVFSRIVFWAEQCISDLDQTSAEISFHAGKAADINRLLLQIHIKEGKKRFIRTDVVDHACLSDVKRFTKGQVSGEIENEPEEKKLILQW